MFDDEKLEKVLNLAESGMQQAALDGRALAARVRSADRRRRVRRAVRIASVPVIALVAGIALRPERMPAPSTTDIATVQSPASIVAPAEIEALEAAAERHQQRARALMADEAVGAEDGSLSADERALLRSDPVDELRQQIDIVAYRMILRADALVVDMRPSAEAIEIYQTVLRQFPATHSAEVARQRLEQVVTQTGESS